MEIGDFYSDITKIGRFTGWRPSTTLESGLTQTIEYYRKHKDKYWPQVQPETKPPMAERV